MQGRIVPLASAKCQCLKGSAGNLCNRARHYRSKEAEEALRDSEEKFRELFDCAPVAYHELDMDGVVRQVNRAECALLGYEAAQMLGRPIWEFIAGAGAATSQKLGVI